jgi:hypothetical protein
MPAIVGPAASTNLARLFLPDHHTMHAPEMYCLIGITPDGRRVLIERVLLREKAEKRRVEVMGQMDEGQYTTVLIEPEVVSLPLEPDLLQSYFRE